MTAPSTRRLTRAEAHAQTHTRLLKAAAQVFSLRGFEGASVDEIAETAGFSRGAFYAHFTNKEALFLALLDQCLADEALALQNLFEREESLAARLTAASRWTPPVLENPLAWRVLVTEFLLHAARHPEVQEELAARYRQQRQIATRLLVQVYEEQGRTPLVPIEQLAEAVLALLHGLDMRRLIVPEALPEHLPTLILSLLLTGEENSLQGK